MITVRMIAAAVVCLFLMQPAWSATLYVETYGDDQLGAAGVNDCRNRNKPCATILRALGALRDLGDASKNSKVVVGPGIYTATSHFTLHEGVKVFSVAGAAGTIIDATGLTANAIFELNGKKAALGARGKGFTILLGAGVDTGILAGAVPSARIEGNRIISMFGTNTHGIRVHSSQNITIRYNTIYSEGAGFFTYGIFSFDGNVDSRHKKWIVARNKVVNAGVCMRIESNVINNGNKITDNLLKGCTQIGMQVLNGDGFEISTSSKDKYSGNVVRMMGFGSTAFSITGGNPVLRKNLADVTDGNSNAFVIEDTTDASLTDNIALGRTPLIEAYGISGLDSATSRINITGNTLSGFSRGIDGFNVDQFKDLSENNVLNSACPLQLVDNVAVPKAFKSRKNFWGDPAGPDLGACNSQVSDAVADGNLKFSPVSKAYPVKFKDKFH